VVLAPGAHWPNKKAQFCAQFFRPLCYIFTVTRLTKSIIRLCTRCSADGTAVGRVEVWADGLKAARAEVWADGAEAFKAEVWKDGGEAYKAEVVIEWRMG